MGYYVSGCKDNGSETVTCDDSEAQFWTLYERKENGLSHALLDCIDRLSAEAAMAAYVERDAIQEQVRALAAESNKWKPEVCPVTKRPFFMWIEHPGGGMVPTYGGPYDSYTIPVVDSDGEFSCERYDHDEGAWVDGVCLSERLIDNQMNVHDDAALREIRAQARAEGIHFAANRLLAAWESGFVDDTPAAAHDISGAILSAVEFLPNADEAEFKRDYADEVRARISAGEQPCVNVE